MKKVVTGNELKNKTLEAIDLLCNTVKTTLGPNGSNAIIDHSAFSPFITNDGVTIAKNIESEDEVANTILELAKEASIKTNENVGDGTTTTLVLLQGIYKAGLKLVEEGVNPILIKKELDSSLQNVILQIKNNSKIPTQDDLEKIAAISANSKDIGKIISDAFKKVKNKNAIKILEGNKDYDFVIYKSGYSLDSSVVSPYYFQKEDKIKLKNVNVILVGGFVDNLETFSNAINDIVKKNQSLMIIADDFSDEVINNTLALYLNGEAYIYLCKIPGYGKEKIDILNDLSSIILANIYDVNKHFEFNNLGFVEQVNIDKYEINLEFKDNLKIKERINLLETLDKDNDLNKEFVDKRIAMMKNGIVEIQVGAYTEAEKREKKMRFDDALESITAASLGIIPGSGLILYKVSRELSELNMGDKIFKSVLGLPIEQIMKNAGVNSNEVLKEIESSNFKKLFNVLDNQYEDIFSTNVIDSTEVVINSIINATSIAGMLLTTSSLVVNEYQNNMQKINNYNEL